MQTSPGALCVISPVIAAELNKLLPAQTDEMVMGKLGISWPTWMKIRNGRAIRLSTARRLLERVERTHQLCPELLAAGLEVTRMSQPAHR